MQVEHIARICLTSRRTTEQQGNFTVGDGLFGKVVVDDEGRTSRVAEVLADGGTCEGGVELHSSGVGGGSGHHDGVRHSAMLGEVLHDAGHCRTFLSDSYINTIYRITFVVEFLLVDNRVDSDGGLTGLAVANDQLTLASTDRNHGIHSLDTGLERFLHRLTEDDTGSLAFEGHLIEVALDVALAVDGVAEGVDDTSAEAFTHADGGDTSGALAQVTFVERLRITKQYHTDIVLFQVEHDAHDVAFFFLEHDQLARLGVLKAIYTCDTVADDQHGADLCQFSFRIIILQLLTQNRSYF